MERNILIAGFGGQGVVLAGNVLAYGCLHEDKNLLATVSYGAEVRGGTARAMITISDDEIDSPIIEKPNLAMVMNMPSYVKYIDNIEEGSDVFINSSMIDAEHHKKEGLNIYPVDATNMAIKMGNLKVANIIMLGALIKVTEILPVEAVFEGLGRAFYKGKKELLYINESAFKAGYEIF